MWRDSVECAVNHSSSRQDKAPVRRRAGEPIRYREGGHHERRCEVRLDCGGGCPAAVARLRTRDSHRHSQGRTGGVLPGVTVEAASPALIEKVRTAVTDGAGQYRITGLNPGTYSLTFRLTGFNIVKREGIELSGTATLTIPVDMRVGARGDDHGHR